MFQKVMSFNVRTSFEGCGPRAVSNYRLHFERLFIETSRNDLNNAPHGLLYRVHASFIPNLMILQRR